MKKTGIDKKRIHTPGPWSLHIGEDYVRIDSRSGINDVLPETMGVSEPNARLMARAPQFLELLIEATNEDVQKSGSPKCGWDKWNARARAAIAKVL